MTTRWFVLALWAASASANCNNTTAIEITLFPGGAPDEVESIGPEAWVESDGETHVYNVSAPTLYYCKNTVQSSGASMIISPGGGYEYLAIFKEGFDVATRLLDFFDAVFVLKYRVPERPELPGLPKWWAPLQDAQRSVSFVRARADELGLRSDRIGFMGFSAGGHLAVHISTAWDPRIYQSNDLIDDVSRRPNFAAGIYPWEIVVDNLTALSPEVSNVTSATPPCFLVHAADDPTAYFQNSVVYFERLVAAGVTATSLEIGPFGEHGFALCQSLAAPALVCDWPYRLKQWLLWSLGVLVNATAPPGFRVAPS
ncbi:hypothetical protein CTAYLR_010460 [Chrysophaeum taylorii]|uniref:BD-FAE-like domain-containing protein n=1 Tax=Chrysophaeum taylorii TaxID=2483200 RepID=A0AAD7U6S0_9STRA|nr:hypothetical protein CTAYLR_010460 [Chrysophaeum taylorii]